MSHKNALKDERLLKVRAKINAAFKIEDASKFEKWFDVAIKENLKFNTINADIDKNFWLLINNPAKFNNKFFIDILTIPSMLENQLPKLIFTVCTYKNVRAYQSLKTLAGANFFKSKSFENLNFHKMDELGFHEDFDYFLSLATPKEIKEYTEKLHYYDLTDFNMRDKVMSHLPIEEIFPSIMKNICECILKCDEEKTQSFINYLVQKNVSIVTIRSALRENAQVSNFLKTPKDIEDIAQIALMLMGKPASNFNPKNEKFRNFLNNFLDKIELFENLSTSLTSKESHKKVKI